MKLLTACLLLLLSINSFAMDRSPYSQASFDAAQKAGIPVLIDVYAAWCPTCERQQIILNRYFSENPKSKIKVLVIDFDKNKSLVTKFRAPRQSTLMLYINNEQKWLGVGETSTRKIEAALNMAAIP